MCSLAYVNTHDMSQQATDKTRNSDAVFEDFEQNFLRIPMALSEAQAILQGDEHSLFDKSTVFKERILAYLRMSSYHLFLFHTFHKNQRQCYLFSLRNGMRGGIHQLPITNAKKAKANEIVKCCSTDIPSILGNIRTSLQTFQADILKKVQESNDIDPVVFMSWFWPRLDGFRRLYQRQVRRFEKIKLKREKELRVIHESIPEILWWADIWTLSPRQIVDLNTPIPVFVNFALIDGSGCDEIDDNETDIEDGGDTSHALESRSKG